MASPSVAPTETELQEIQSLIKAKKKDSVLQPQLEKLFTKIVDTDKWTCLIDCMFYFPAVCVLHDTY